MNKNNNTISVKDTIKIRNLLRSCEKRILKSTKKNVTLTFKIDDEHNVTNFRRKSVTTEMILDIVGEYFNIDRKTLKTSKSRKDVYVKARMFSYYFLYDIAKLTFVEIGKIFEKDRTTIGSSLQVFYSYIMYEDMKKIHAELLVELQRNKVI